jgi:hypothetical protein
MRVTASPSKSSAETTPAPSDAVKPAPAAEASGSDFIPHKVPEDGADHGLHASSPAAAKSPNRKTLPAFVLGMAGGLSVVALLALVGLILNPLADLTERLSVAETHIAAAATRRAVETNDKRLAAVEARVDAMRADLDALNKNPTGGSVDVSALKNQLAQIDQAITALQQDSNKTAKPTQSAALAQDAARLTLALVIGDKIEQGQSIVNELQVLTPLQEDPASLGLLKPWAEGTPSQAALVQELARVYPALIKAAPAPADETMSQFLLRHLKQWVHWRRLDQQDPTDPETMVQLIHADLQKGMNEDALRRVRTLPSSMQSLTVPLQNMLTQRIEAMKAADQLFQTAMSQLLRSAQSKGGAQ